MTFYDVFETDYEKKNDALKSLKRRTKKPMLTKEFSLRSFLKAAFGKLKSIIMQLVFIGAYLQKTIMQHFSCHRYPRECAKKSSHLIILPSVREKKKEHKERESHK